MTCPMPPFGLGGGELYEGDVCPGYLGQLQSVNEGAEAYAARSDGVLTTGYPDITNPLWEAANVLTQAVNLKQRDDMPKPKGGRRDE